MCVFNECEEEKRKKKEKKKKKRSFAIAIVLRQASRVYRSDKIYNVPIGKVRVGILIRRKIRRLTRLLQSVSVCSP